MAFTKITEADLKNKGVIGLPDTPNLSQTDMQEKFDEIALDVLVPKFNELIDALEAASASGSLGIMDGEAESDVQTVINNLKTAVSNIGMLSHTHENKAALDTITSTLLSNIDSVLLMLSGITSVATTVSNTPSAIPTCRAIVNYVSMLGGGDMLKSEYDSNSDGTVDDSDKLGGELPSYYQKATDTDLETTDKTTTGAINEVLDAVGDVADDLSNFEDVYDESAGGVTIETIGQQSIGTYDIGELFVAKDHYVYKATAIIAVGNVLSNSNCTKTNIKAEINSVNTAVLNKVSKFVGGGYVPVDSLAYDSTNKKLGLKVNGADTVIPFSGGSLDYTFLQDVTASDGKYTFLNDYSSVLVVACPSAMSRGGTPSVSVSVSITNNREITTVTERITSIGNGGAGTNYSLAKYFTGIYEIKDVKAGDVLTVSQSLSGNFTTVYCYRIMVQN